MRYISTTEAAQRWQVSSRYVRKCCQENRISGCTRVGSVWMIPEDTPNPTAKQASIEKTEQDYAQHLAVVLNAEYCSQMPVTLVTEDDRIICDIENTLLSGNLEQAYQKAVQYYNSQPTGIFLLLAGYYYFVLAYYLGRVEEASLLKPRVLDIVHTQKYPIAAVYADLLLTKENLSVPFLDVPPSILPLALYTHHRIQILDIMEHNNFSYMTSLELYCCNIEASQNNTITAYYHSMLAMYYNFIGNTSLHDLHVQKALNIILPRKWYFILVEHSFAVD